MKIKKLVTSLVLVVSLASPIVAFAANVGGGTWNYGVGWTGTFGYSNYHHATRFHGSAIKYNTKVVASANASKGDWANSSYSIFPPTRLSYYWNYVN